MNKQEAIEKIKDLYSFVMEDGPFEVDLINKGHAVNIISQIDEPKKPVVPQFVADWYEEHKDNFEYSVQCLCVQGYKPLRQIDVWFDKTKNKPTETLVMMHKFGYEVKKEEVEECNQRLQVGA